MWYLLMGICVVSAADNSCNQVGLTWFPGDPFPTEQSCNDQAEYLKQKNGHETAIIAEDDGDWGRCVRRGRSGSEH